MRRASMREVLELAILRSAKAASDTLTPEGATGYSQAVVNLANSLIALQMHGMLDEPELEILGPSS